MLTGIFFEMDVSESTTEEMLYFQKRIICFQPASFHIYELYRKNEVFGCDEKICADIEWSITDRSEF